MRTFLKFLGVFILLAGELVLIVPWLLRLQNNASLLTGLVLVVAGLALYVILNKKIS
ncbi:MAG: hypothetical protein LBR64_06880 [Dysgonamonadaceae bacterium]|jgi:hypothetical protein|nr:hypothetical protein [Dysgonamonadaceae bacterium]